MSNPTALVQKLWNYCSILRDDGLSYGELASQARHELVARGCLFAARNVVVEQLTFLRMSSGVRRSTSPAPRPRSSFGPACWHATGWQRCP